MKIVTRDGKVLIIDNVTAGTLPPTFEKDYLHVVVVSSNGAEMRQYESLSPNGDKYAVHSEMAQLPQNAKLVPIDFAEIFERQYDYDNTDVRKSVRMALKSSNYVLLPDNNNQNL